MNPLRIKAIAVKEFIHILRDPRSLGMAIAIPMLLLILFGYALTLDVDNVPMVIWDQDKSQVSQDLILDFKGSPYFKIIGYADGYPMLQDMIDENRAMMALVIPKDFSALTGAYQKAPVQLLVDGSDSNTATIAIGYVDAVVSRYNTRLVSEAVSRMGIRASAPVDMRSRVWFNPDLKSRNYIIPGIIAVIMMIIAALLTSLTVAREWEQGTMEQLIATPVKGRELVAGKLLPYFAIGLMDVVIAVGMGQFMFHVPLRGSVALLFLLSGIFLMGALSLGMLISIATKNQLLASQMAIITTFLPTFLLSGFAFAISNMPKAVQALSHIVPARYFMVILKGIYLKGVGLKVLGMQVVYLFLFSFITINLAVRKFKKKVS